MTWVVAITRDAGADRRPCDFHRLTSVSRPRPGAASPATRSAACVTAFANRGAAPSAAPTAAARPAAALPSAGRWPDRAAAAASVAAAVATPGGERTGDTGRVRRTTSVFAAAAASPELVASERAVPIDADAGHAAGFRSRVRAAAVPHRVVGYGDVAAERFAHALRAARLVRSRCDALQLEPGGTRRRRGRSVGQGRHEAGLTKPRIAKHNGELRATLQLANTTFFCCRQTLDAPPFGESSATKFCNK
eukprot:356062-Chlamydomonas_euryale.AAC.2